MPRGPRSTSQVRICPNLHHVRGVIGTSKESQYSPCFPSYTSQLSSNLGRTADARTTTCRKAYVRLIFWLFSPKLKRKYSKTQAEFSRNSRNFRPKLKDFFQTQYFSKFCFHPYRKLIQTNVQMHKKSKTIAIIDNFMRIL